MPLASMFSTRRVVILPSGFTTTFVLRSGLPQTKTSIVSPGPIRYS